MRWAPLLVVPAVLACGEPPRDEEELPCEVERIVASRCLGCHGEQPSFGAPMPLTRAGDFRALTDRVAERITSKERPMPPPPNAALSEQDRAALLAWLGEGAPSGTACATPTSPDGGIIQPLGCEPDVELRPAAAFELPAGGADLLVCYGVSVPADTKRHVVGFAPRVDNASVLHHASLLRTDVPLSATPAPCPASDAMQSWRVVYGWAPGAGSFELPPEAGFAVDPGSSFVVQLHYVSAAGASGSDASGFDLCTSAELRDFDADIMAFGTHEIFVPPHASAEVECSITVPTWGATVRLFASFPHMHRLGTSFSARVDAGPETPAVDLGSVPAWDIDRQTWLPIDHVLTPGDTITTRCAWNNPNPWGVGFGPSMDDEMCYGFSMYYPRIEDPSWHWMLPALGSECKD